MSNQQAVDTSEKQLLVDQFIGRERLLAQVDEAIHDVPKNHVFFFLGEGGIGKTALLRKIYKKYKGSTIADREALVVAFDLAQAGLETYSSILRDVTRQFLEDGFYAESSLIQDLDEPIERALREGRPEEEIVRLSQATMLRYTEYFNRMHQESKRRILVILDTIEVTSDRTTLEALSFVTLHKNSVHVYAGRPEPEVIERAQYMSQAYQTQGWNVIGPIFLEPFTLSESMEYFERVLAVSPRPEMVQTINFLAEGKPVLLALAAEWFKQNIKLPPEINLSKAELGKLAELELKQLRRYFERALVEQVRNIRSPLNKAILYMAFFDRRYDRRILQLVLDIQSESEIEEIEFQLRQMAFIRYFLEESSGLLHDEAKLLINRHAWPPRDPIGEERQVLARKVIEKFYVPEISALRDSIVEVMRTITGTQLKAYYVPQEQQMHQLEMECLDYCYRISCDEGRRYITELIRDSVSVLKRDGMRHELERHKQANQFEVEVAMTRFDFMRGFYEGREILEQALQQEEEISSWYRMTLLQELSDAPTDPEEKAAYLRRAMKIAEEMQDRASVARITNDLGLMYRRQGLWIQAEQAYKQALEILREVVDPAQKAATLNNLAYVKLLQGEFDLAESLADIALEMRQAQGNQLGVAFSYLTKGEIVETMDNRGQAWQAYQTAAVLFEKAGRAQYHAQALIHLAETKRHEHDFTAARELLEPGLTQPLSEIRAQAERELGALYRIQGLLVADKEERTRFFADAVAAFRKSFETSQHKRDWHGQAEALYDLTFMDFLMDGEINEDSVHQLREILTERDYPVLEAELDEIYADVLYVDGQIQGAFEHYIEVAKILSTHHIRKYHSMFERFKHRFLEQPSEMQCDLCDAFAQVIAELPQQSRLRSSLSNLCRAIQIAA